jgi:purine nucleosidase
VPAFPTLDDAYRLRQLSPREGVLRMVLDTDTYNEIDDQFAVAHALASPERVRVEAIHAAPFHNDRSTGPADGMEKSYEEIQRLLGMMPSVAAPPVYRGARAYLDVSAPAATDATADLIARAMASTADDPLYVVAIGAITNVATAILLEPRIIEKIVVVWLGGHVLHWRDTREFNLKQDIPAARVVLDSGVPLVLLPCGGVVDRLLTSNEELAAHLGGRGRVADYLVKIVREYNRNNQPVWSKVIWDIAATAYLITPKAVWTHLHSSPIVTDNGTWSIDHTRHPIRIAHGLSRDAIFADCFAKIASLG